MSRVPLAPALAALGLAGCSLLTDLGGYTTGPADGARDAGIEGAPTDAPLDRDGPVGAAGFCSSAGPHAFCADFDVEPSVVAGWTRFRDNGSSFGTVAFDEVLFRSAPRAATLRLGANAPSCSFSQLTKTLPGTFSRTTLAFDLWPGDATGASAPAGVGMAYVQLGQGCAVVLAATGNDPDIYRQDRSDGANGTHHSLSRQAIPGRWSRLVVEVAASDAPPPFVRVTIDGQVALELPSGPAICAPHGEAHLLVGPHCANGSQRLEMRVDNVTADAQ